MKLPECYLQRYKVIKSFRVRRSAREGLCRTLNKKYFGYTNLHPDKNV
ncbi:MAG: hypothetical protein ABFD10_08800 [Prolixibacteraceae bacterium]